MPDLQAKQRKVTEFEGWERFGSSVRHWVAVSIFSTSARYVTSHDHSIELTVGVPLGVLGLYDPERPMFLKAGGVETFALRSLAAMSMLSPDGNSLSYSYAFKSVCQDAPTETSWLGVFWGSERKGRGRGCKCVSVRFSRPGLASYVHESSQFVNCIALVRFRMWEGLVQYIRGFHTVLEEEMKAVGANKVCAFIHSSVRTCPVLLSFSLCVHVWLL